MVVYCMRFEIFGLFFLVMCFGFVSSGLFGDDFDVDSSCEEVVSGFGEGSDFVIPDGIPFSDDVFDVYLDDEFFASFELKEKKLESVQCEAREDVSYDVFISSSLLSELEGFDGDVVDFYNEKKASGDLKIDAVGFGKSVKLGLINFGLWVAGWFS